jgi:hypothetical protein
LVRSVVVARVRGVVVALLDVVPERGIDLVSHRARSRTHRVD